jgi:LDH2 family malate/lactate/ureidoglycolate dehydrogenase
VDVPVKRVREQIRLVLTAWGMPADMAETTSDVLVETDVTGVDSHGVSMLPAYEQLLANGGLDLAARPVIARENAVTALVDGRAGLGHYIGDFAMRLAISKASSNAIGAVSVFNSHHFGAAGYYAALAAKHGLIGFATTNANESCVVPTRAAVPRLGTNPLAFAAPTRRNAPFLLDMATSTVAANKVKVHYLNDKAVPAGWVVDESGKSVQDPEQALKYSLERPDGGLTPVGGTEVMSSYKGYGLGMMVQILSGTLSGAAFSGTWQRQEGVPANVGHFLLAIDPGAFRPGGDFEDDLDAAIDALHETPPVDPAEPVLVAGDPQARAREKRMREGIPMPQRLVEQLRGICQRADVCFVIEDGISPVNGAGG